MEKTRNNGNLIGIRIITRTKTTRTTIKTKTTTKTRTNSITKISINQKVA